MRAKLVGFMVLILFVLICASALVFHRQVMHLLRPRVSMVGGTSLVYQIKAPAEGYSSSSGHSLAEDEIAALKRRIDPDDSKNYIWRPVGTDRIEIQIPAQPGYAAATKARDAHIEAHRVLETFNISRQDVTDAVEQLTGEGQKARLNTLTGGSKPRQDLFSQLLQARANMQAAHAVQDADAEARASVLYDQLLDQIDATNIKPRQLEVILEEPAAQRKSELDAVKASAGGSPDRLKAIGQYVAAFDAYRAIKGTDEVADLKQELQGMGVLEFRIVAEPGQDLSRDEHDLMQKRLMHDGPQPVPGDKLGWFEVDRPPDFRWPTETFGGKQYMLCWLTPKDSMVNGPGLQRWSMEHVSRQMGAGGQEVVAFQLDREGGILFLSFTAAHLNRPLAAVLDGKIFSVANIQSAIGAEGEISGDFTQAELSYLVSTLNAGSLPAPLQPEPVSETTIGPGQAQNHE